MKKLVTLCDEAWKKHLPHHTFVFGTDDAVCPTCKRTRADAVDVYYYPLEVIFKSSVSYRIKIGICLVEFFVFALCFFFPKMLGSILYFTLKN